MVEKQYESIILDQQSIGFIQGCTLYTIEVLIRIFV